MSEMPREINAFRNVWGEQRWHNDVCDDFGIRYVRGNIADEMLMALKAVAANARERDRQAGDPVLNQVQAAIAKAEGKT